MTLETAIVHTRVRGQGASPRGRPVVALPWLASAASPAIPGHQQSVKKLN